MRLEVVDGERDFGRVGHRQQMQHRVGRAADGHHHRDRVLEGLAGHDFAREQSASDGATDGLADCAALSAFS